MAEFNVARMGGGGKSVAATVSIEAHLCERSWLAEGLSIFYTLSWVTPPPISHLPSLESGEALVVRQVPPREGRETGAYGYAPRPWFSC